MIAEMLLKRSAKLILGRSELEIIRGVCQAIVDVDAPGPATLNLAQLPLRRRSVL